MRFALRHYNDSHSASIDFTIYTLARADECFRLLAPQQRDAVRQFLEFMALDGGRNVDSDAARRALKDVWNENRENSQQDAGANPE